MKKLLRFNLLLVHIVFIVFNAKSQNAIPQKTLQPNQFASDQNFFTIQEEFYHYWNPKNVVNGYYDENGVQIKAYGWKQFKRWEWYWENRVDPQTGTFPSVGRAEIYQQLQQSKSSRSANGNWQSLGPSASPGGYAGLGRINVVGFRPGDNNTVYAGSPSGGLWKSVDGGSNWSVLTDANAVLGVSDIVVIAGASTATDIVYIATGDRDGGSMWSLGGGQYPENSSIGVLKSTDGGSSWSTTNLTFTTNQKRTVNRLLIDPNSSSTLYAATSSGLYKTTDGGAAWSNQLTSIEFISIEFNPGDPTILYGSTRAGKIYKSVNSGANWTEVLAVANATRIQLAVSSNDPTYVYAVVVNSARGLEGIYRSTNSGDSYTKVFDGSISGNNILGSNCDGTSTGGQGTYDLAIAADPTNKLTLFVGGINTWKSIDGGSTWAINTIWALGNFPGCTAVETHADKHFLGFQNGSTTLWEGNDGGVYKTTNYGVNWSFLSSGMEISQIYRLGVSQSSSTAVIAGLQDNGTKSRSGSTWTDVIGGDGMECAIDPTNSSTQYGEYQNGNIYRTTNNWNNSTLISGGLSGSRAWVTPFLLDPSVNTTLFAGCQDVWKSTNQGTAWTKISNWSGTTIRSLTVAPSNSNTIYAATQTILYVTTDGGSNWSNITGTLPVSSSYITYVSVKSDDPQTVWVSFGEYNANSVYQTTNGGLTWTDISAGLPNIPVMCVIQNKLNTASIELYAGTDVGIYVKVGSGGWTAFNNGLPNVVVTELEIYYNNSTPSLSRLRAATYGRGLWESELYSPEASPPVVDFSADVLYPAVGQTVTFTDLSNNIPASWLWSITPASITYTGGTSATSQNPQIQFDALGDYTIQLTATNAYGSGSKSKTNYISVGTLQTYCAASGGGDSFISGIQLETINNTGTTAGGYTNYTTMSTDLYVNQSYYITVTYGSAYSNDDLGIWIDWNQDGDFEDIGENVVCTVGLSFLQETYSIAVPANPLLGGTTMRIRLKNTNTDCGSPCGTTTLGEVEDYKIIVLPATNTWTGSSSSDWATAANWSAGAVPISTNNVVIANVANLPIVSSTVAAPAICRSLVINTGASLTIAPNGALTVEGVLENNGDIVIQSNTTGTGSLLHDATDISGTIQLNVTGGSIAKAVGYKYHLLSIPLKANIMAGDVFTGTYLWEFIPNVAAPGTWSGITELNTELDVRNGYLSYNASNDYTFSFEGTLMNGTFTSNIGLTTSGYYNLIPNPYPSAIDWDAINLIGSNLEPSIWFFDSQTGNYTAYNGGDPDGGNIIPVGQAVFVKASNDSPVLQFDNTARLHSDKAFYKQQKLTASNKLLVKAISDNLTDEAYIRFRVDASNAFDSQNDATKLYGFGGAPQLYSLSTDGQELSINTMALSEELVSVPIGFKMSEAGEACLQFDLIDSFDPELEIHLQDQHTNSITNLRLQNSYCFMHETENPDMRFLIHFGGFVGVKENMNLSKMRCWSDGELIFIDIDGETGQQAKVEVLSLLGNTVRTHNITLSAPSTILCRQKGVILLRVSTAKQQYIQKLTIL